jgi:hypothetical protein
MGQNLNIRYILGNRSMGKKNASQNMQAEVLV